MMLWGLKTLPHRADRACGVTIYRRELRTQTWFIQLEMYKEGSRRIKCQVYMKWQTSQFNQFVHIGAICQTSSKVKIAYLADATKGDNGIMRESWIKILIHNHELAFATMINIWPQYHLIGIVIHASCDMHALFIKMCLIGRVIIKRFYWNCVNHLATLVNVNWFTTRYVTNIGPLTVELT